MCTLGILTYCNAGSLLALLRDGANVRVLESGGMPLGLFTHTTFEAVVLALQEGDALLHGHQGCYRKQARSDRVWRRASQAATQEIHRQFSL